MRPVLVGMNDPASDDPSLALHPSARPNSAGCRLFQMVREADPTVCELEYLASLDRRNLVADECWTRDAAKRRSADFLSDLWRLRVVFLGTQVPACLGIRRLPTWYDWSRYEPGEIDYVVVPHPSGMNRVYNDREYRLKTGRLVAGLIRETTRA